MRTTAGRRLRGNLPLLASTVTSAVAALDLVVVLRPSWHPPSLVGHVDPLLSLAALRAAVIPLCAALLVVSAYLRRGHARALYVVVLILGLLGATKLVDGRDVDGGLATLAVAVLVFAVRRDFPVRSASLESGRLTIPASAAVSGAGLLLTLWVLTPDRPSADDYLSSVVAGTASDGASAAIVLVGSFLALTLLPALLGPGKPRTGRDEDAVRGILRSYGSDTLAAFKLRADLDHFVSRDGRAFAGFRVEAGTLLLAGDPVGDPDAVPGLLRELQSLADAHGLRLGVVGAGRALLPLYHRLGMRALYIGDEAIVDLAGFSLEGRAIRKVRQSVSRLERAGFRAETIAASSVDDELWVELERVSDAWRAGRSERGFAMAVDSIVGPATEGSLLVVARDASGHPRGFLQFLPTHGRAAMSLSAMRREREAPNGLTEFLVCAAAVSLRDRGVQEMSLNFAAFGSVFRSPGSRVGRVWRQVLRLGDGLFQIESLYRFNAKFRPRWEPRYLVFDRALALPRVGLAALWAEGQLPRVRRA
jgi:lysyl-tRNA synthetase class 2